MALLQFAPPHSAAFLRLNLAQPFPKHRHVIKLQSSTTSAISPDHHPDRLIKPYLQSQWQPILYGWLCSSLSVYSLSQIVPRVGKFTTLLNSVDAVRLRNEGLALGILILVRHVATYLQQAFLWDAALTCVYKIRVDVFSRVLQRDLGFFEGGDGVPAGDIAYRITAEAADVADTVYYLLNTIVPSSLQLSAMAAQMVVINPILSLISALVIPSMAFVVGYLGEKLRQISNRAHLSVATLSAYLNEVLPSILFVKANNAEVGESVRFQLLASADLFESSKKKKMKALIPQIVHMIYFGSLFAFCAASLMVSGGSFNWSATASFITSLVLLIEPLQDVGKAYNEFKQGQPAIERLFSLARFESQVLEKPDAIDLDYVAGEVKFCSVSFKYGEGLPLVLSGLDLHIKAGETVALVGPSGGGKTTFAKLLLRLYDPIIGSIQIDGRDIQSIQLASLRRHIGLVSQDIVCPWGDYVRTHFASDPLESQEWQWSIVVNPDLLYQIQSPEKTSTLVYITLFSGTVAENIAYRDLMTKIDMERVELAARTANADEFIEMLPDRYQTNVGPRGSLLSGGQKQRLAIARALYQNPSILILDEATSALDSRSEQLVRQALQRLMQNRTVLVISHRLETVLMAERIFLLDDGKLQELPRSSLLDGQHASLASTTLVI